MTIKNIKTFGVLAFFVFTLVSLPVPQAHAATKTVELSTTPASDDPIFDGDTAATEAGVTIEAPLNDTMTPVDDEASAASPNGYTWHAPIPELCVGSTITGVRVKTNSAVEDEAPISGIFLATYDVSTLNIFDQYSINDNKGEDLQLWWPGQFAAPAVDRGIGDGQSLFPASLGFNGPLDATWDLSGNNPSDGIGIYIQHWINGINQGSTTTAQTTIQSVTLSYDDSGCSGPSRELTSPVSSQPVLLTTPSGTNLVSTTASKESSLSVTDPAYDYPSGLISFSFDTTETNNEVSLTFVTDKLPNQVVARKYNPNTNAYFTIPNASITETTYNNQHALLLTYTITDNGDLDLDPTTGTITDPVGLATTTTDSPSTGLNQYWLLDIKE